MEKIDSKKENVLKKVKISKFDLYYIFMAISTIVFFLRYFKFEYRVVNYGIYALSAISIIVYATYWKLEDFSIKERLIHVFLLIIIFAVYYFSGMKYEYLFFNILAIIGIKNKSMKKIMKIIFIIYVSCLLIHIILLSTGIINNKVFLKISSGKVITTHLFGFTHGNTAFTILFTLICSLIYYKFNKLRIWHLIALEIISLLLYLAFRARTGIIIITIFLVGTAIFKLVRNKKNTILKIFSTIQIITVPTLFIGTYLLSTTFYNTKLSNIINKFITDRIKISNIYFEAVPLSLLPQNFDLIKDLSFDNMYSFILCSFGLIFTIAIIIVFILLYINLLKKKRYFDIFILTLFMIYCYAEKMYINAFRNPSILFLGVLLYKNFSMFDWEKEE